MKEVKIKQKLAFRVCYKNRCEGGIMEWVFYLLLKTCTYTLINLDKIHKHVATIAWINNNAPKVPKTLKRLAPNSPE